jgi:hypothetical protein
VAITLSPRAHVALLADRRHRHRRDHEQAEHHRGDRPDERDARFAMCARRDHAAHPIANW